MATVEPVAARDLRALVPWIRSPDLAELLDREAAALAPFFRRETLVAEEAWSGSRAPPPGFALVEAGEVELHYPSAREADNPRTVQVGGTFGRYRVSPPAPKAAAGPRKARARAPTWSRLAQAGRTMTAGPIEVATSAHLRVMSRATVPTRLLCLPTERLAEARQAVRGLGETLDFLGQLVVLRYQLLHTLSGNLAFRKVRLPVLDRLLDRARRVAARHGELVPGSAAPYPGLFLVLRGRGHLVDRQGEHPPEIPEVDFERGSVFGAASTLTAAENTFALKAGGNPAGGPPGEGELVCAHLDIRTIGLAFASSPAMQRAAVRTGVGLGFAGLLRRGMFPELVYVQTAPGEIDQPALTWAVARHLARRYHDPVALLRLVPRERVRPPRVEPDGLVVVDLDADEVAERCAAARSAGGPAPARERVTLAFHRLVHLAVTGSAVPTVYAQYLVAIEAPVPADAFGEAIRRVTAVGRNPLALIPPRGSERMPRVPVGTAGPGRTVQEVGTVRVDFGADHPGADRLAAAEVAVDRIARGITERLVGMALGGGGALGFAHVNLLREFHGRGIPVDIVSGSSFGSLVGAFYATEGLAGLDRLLQVCPEANRALQASMLFPSRFDRWLDKVLGGARIEDLGLTFLPVCTDLVEGVPFVPRSGPVSRGVRLSGAFPPMFLTQDIHGMRLADGGFVANVPAQSIVWEGANVIVASNIVPAPSSEAGVDQEGRLFRTFLRGMNIIRRVADAYSASFTLIHEAGAWQAVVADVIFEPTSGSVDFWDLSRGAEVVEKSADVARSAGNHAEAVWRAVRAPMVPVASVWPEMAARAAG